MKKISLILLSFLILGCNSDKKEIESFEPKPCIKKYPSDDYGICFAQYQREYKEWVFVNWSKDLTGGGLCNNDICDIHYWLVDLDDDEKKQYVKNYFPDFSMEELKKKWLNEPMPKGLKEFLETEVSYELK